jgi:hypothetical protein
VSGIRRAHVRDLFLRLLGLIFIAAFASLLVQAHVLFGARGLLPACEVTSRTTLLQAPSLFLLDCSDRALVAAAVTGAVLGLGLAVQVAPRWCLVGCWLLYLSFVSVGRDFLGFQWDNLLLESAFFALFVTTRGEPHPIGVFLLQWLLFRLHVESGLAKLLLGDPTWRDLTALATYYETAPLPTWIGWWAHQMPLWAHQLTALGTYLVELVVPFAIWGPRRLRAAAFVLMVGMQVSIMLTANYGYFNYLSMALCLWVLDDGHLAAVARRVGVVLAPHPEPARQPAATAALALVAAILVPLSVVPFLPLIPGTGALQARLAPVAALIGRLRSVNAYHLFAQMTRIRREPVIEGSADGVEWRPYHFRWKPGPVDRAPAFVAPHQPRVDFQLWFLLLGGRPAPWVDTLLDRLLHDPAAVASLFADDPFPDGPPAAVRIAAYRYRFTDRATRRATGAWWTRELEGTTRPRYSGRQRPSRSTSLRSGMPLRPVLSG